VTAIWTHAGWLFLAVILDLFSRRVVGWATSANSDRALALDALNAALVTRRPRPGLLHHSDRGGPYASGHYHTALERAGAVASMSRKGDCWDNAVAESFFATLKTEALNDCVHQGDDGATRAITKYIDEYYNTKRRHSFIDYESPIEFELKSQLAATAASSTCPLGGGSSARCLSGKRVMTLATVPRCCELADS
jgi:transposase InsO family protein